jgi:hypothetical protein
MEEISDPYKNKIQRQKRGRPVWLGDVKQGVDQLSLAGGSYTGSRPA